MATAPSVTNTFAKRPTSVAAWLLRTRNFFAREMERLVSTPSVTRPIFNLIREYKPILAVRGYAVVTKYRDVHAVLADTANFESDYPRAGDDQIVGMRTTPEYFRLKNLMMAGLGANDSDTLAAIVNRFGQQHLPAQPARFDAVSEYSRPLAVGLTDSYLGVPADPKKMMRWTRTILRDVFLNLTNDPEMTAEADVSRKELADHLDLLVANAKSQLASGNQLPDNFFGRLFMKAASDHVPDEVIRNLMAGLVTALTDNISNSIARSMKVLLDNPRQLEGASEAARQNNVELLLHYVYEALRFNPETPLLIRKCSEAVELGSGTSRMTTIAKDTIVVAGIEGAMFDDEPDAFPDPQEFSIKRPLDDYLHFGWGMHRCFGRGIADAVLPAAVGALLRLPNLRRVTGWEGRVAYEGAFPTRMLVEFGG